MMISLLMSAKCVFEMEFASKKRKFGGFPEQNCRDF